MPELGDEDLDPHLLMWDVQRNVDVDGAAAGADGACSSASATCPRAPGLVAGDQRGRGGPLRPDPGHPVTGRVDAALPLVRALWRGDVEWAQAFRSGELAVDGPTSVRRGLPRWLTRSDFAPVPRP